MDKDCNTRRRFAHLTAQGHVVADRLGLHKPSGRLDWILGCTPEEAPDRYAYL